MRADGSATWATRKRHARTEAEVVTDVDDQCGSMMAKLRRPWVTTIGDSPATTKVRIQMSVTRQTQ